MNIRRISIAHTVVLVGLSAILTSPSGLAQEIIVDNLSADTSQNGSWYTSVGANPYLGHSLYSNNGSRFYWNAEVPVPGDYDVYAWWTYHPNRSGNVPYFIRRGSPAPIRVNVDQSDPDLGGQWNLLGRFSFDQRVTVSVAAYNGQASADAIRIVPTGSGLPQLEEVVLLPGSQHLGDPPNLAFRWETTVVLLPSQVNGVTSADIEFVALNSESSFVEVNGRAYLLPYSAHFPLDQNQLSSYARSSITIPSGLLREGTNTIAFQAGPINQPGNLYDDFFFGDVVIVLGR